MTHNTKKRTYSPHTITKTERAFPVVVFVVFSSLHELQVIVLVLLFFHFFLLILRRRGRRRLVRVIARYLAVCHGQNPLRQTPSYTACRMYNFTLFESVSFIKCRVFYLFISSVCLLCFVHVLCDRFVKSATTSLSLSGSFQL